MLGLEIELIVAAKLSLIAEIVVERDVKPILLAAIAD
jgi:hypothetical protein